MTALRDDCFAGVAGPLGVAAARALMLERLQPPRGEIGLPLAEAAGRILARDLVAPLNVPPYDNAAVDGYAVRHRDLQPDGPTRLRLAGRSAAGHPSEAGLNPGEAQRILTGAVLPAGCDSVAMQEDCRLEGDSLVLPPGLKRGANCRRAGEDLAQGSVALQAGRRLRPVDLGLAASLGLETLPVFPALRAALFSSGDEVTAPGQPLAPGGLYDANRFSVGALLRAQGVAVTDLGILPDEPEAVAAALAEAAAGHDLIVTSGGVSVGDEDHLRAAVAARGSLHLWRIAIKPGKPLALGRLGSALFVGLPGNPVAAVVTFVALIRPLLQRLGGETPREPLAFPVTAGFAFEKKPGRQEWLRVCLSREDDGWQARLFPRQGSGILSSLALTDGFIVLDEAVTRVEPGQRLDFLSYAEVLA